MGVHLLSRQFPISGCIPSDCEATVRRNSLNAVRRSLFGPVDHQEAMSFFQKEMAKMEQEKSIQWNFDFVNERPLEGSYQWERVEGERSTPKLTCKVTKFKSSRKSPLKNLKRSQSRANQGSVLRQTTITEFVSISKKSRLAEEEDEK